VTTASITPAQVVDQAKQWVGVKFLHQGRTRNGCDCLGFIAACMAELDSWTLMFHLPANYSRNPQTLLIDGLNELTREIPLEAGVLILFQFPGTEHPSHAAIYTGESLIHAYQPNGKVVEHGHRAQWRKYAKSYWALPLVTYS
jgi:cell wall-associated NlpC family hydrolase